MMREGAGNVTAVTGNWKIRATRAMLWYMGLPAFVFVVGSGFALYANYLLFHALAEGFSIIIAFCAMTIATVGWRSTSSPRDKFLGYLAIGIGWCAVLDVVHTLVFKGMALLPTESANPPTQLWIAARYLQALVMISAPMVLRRDVRLRHIHLVYGSATLAIIAAVFGGWFPVAYVDGQGLTPFKIYSEYLISAMLAACMALYWRRREQIERRDAILLCAAIVAMILAEFAFTRYVSVYATANMIGHLLKIVAYWFIFVALVYQRVSEPVDTVRRLEGGIEEIQQRMLRAVNASNDGAWDWDPATGEAWLSPRWKQLLGYEDHELPNREDTFFRNLHPDDVARAREALRAELEERKPYHLELRLRCKDGEYRWFLARGMAERDAEGHPMRMAGAITDIHARKQAEAQLVESEARFRALFQSLPVPAYSWRHVDGDFVLDDCNEAANAFTGGKVRNIFGKRARQAYPADSQVLADMQECWSTHRIVEREMEYRLLSTSELKYLRIRYAVVPPERLVVSTEDYTERRRAELALAESEARFRQMFENNASVLMLMEPESGKIVEVNAAAEKYYGYAPGVLKTMSIDQINTLGAAETLAERRRAVREERNFFVFPHRLASGAIRTVEVRSSPVIVGGQQLLFSIITDVTKLKEYERELVERTQALRARNEELTRFSDVAVDRELRMIELKQEINALCERLGEAPRYAAVAAPDRPEPRGQA